MKIIPLLFLASTLVSNAAVLSVGSFSPVGGNTYENVSYTWELRDNGQLNIHNTGSDSIATRINFTSSVDINLDGNTIPKFKVDLKRLPQGNAIGFVSDYRFKAKPSRIKNGIDVGEYEQFKFTVLPSSFEIGMHIQSIDQCDSSATFIASYNSITSVPEPSPLSLLGCGTLALILRRNK